jgi:hypothetical protein
MYGIVLQGVHGVQVTTHVIIGYSLQHISVQHIEVFNVKWSVKRSVEYVSINLSTYLSIYPSIAL